MSSGRKPSSARPSKRSKLRENPDASSRLIDNLSDLRVLKSPVRQEIMDTIQACGTCSIADIARELGRPTDGLYYHFRKLIEAGLIVAEGKRKTVRREEVLYRTRYPNKALKIKYQSDNEEFKQATVDAVTCICRIAAGDFEKGIEMERAVSTGALRNILGGRQKGWLSKSDVRKFNILLKQLNALFDQKKADNRKLFALTLVIAPVEEHSPRRTKS